MEFTKETAGVLRRFIAKVKEKPDDKQCAALMPIVPAVFKPVAEALQEVLKDREIRDDLLPRLKEAKSLYVEIVGNDDVAYGYDINFTDQAPFIEFTEKKRGKDQFGLRFLFKDLIKLVEGCLDDGRFTLADVLDFYARGKLQLIMTEKRAEWTGMSLFGGFMFYSPQIRSVMQKNKKSGNALGSLGSLAAP